MAIYNSGSVRVKVGSAAVRGNNTSFTTYVDAGDLFKLTNDAAFYTVAAITNATNLTLSARYANSAYETQRADEHIATFNTGTRVYTGTLDNTPVLQNSVSINASDETYTDDGAGVLTGAPTGSGTVDYDTGSWSITKSTFPVASTNCLATYDSGDTLNSMSYQVVVDYTTNYNFPELSLNDVNFQHVYTKAIRMIDSKLLAPNATNVSASSDNLSVDGVTTVKVDTTTSNIRIGGLRYGVDGQIVHMVKTTSNNNLIIEHNEGVASQDVYTKDAADVTLATYGGVTLVCDGTDWFVVAD